MKRFLESKSQFPKDYNGKDVTFDRVTRMIKNKLYAGYLERPERGIPLTKAVHEPLITYDTFQINQHRMTQAAVAPAKKDIAKDFPLRGFLVCENCGRRLTSCWSQSKTGRKYPYYLCPYKGCPEKRKSTPRIKVEEQFDDILRSLVPSKATFDIAEQMFKDAWGKRESFAKQEVSRLKQSSSQLDKEISNLLHRLVQTESKDIVGAYENKISVLQSEKALVDAETSNISTPEHSFEEMFELSMRFLANPYEIWKNGSYTLKRVVLRLVFSAPLKFSRKDGVRTPETTLPFKALSFVEVSNLKMVRAVGVEPTRAQGPTDFKSGMSTIPSRPHACR